MRSTKAPRVVRAALKADKKRRRQAYFEAVNGPASNISA